MNGNHNKREKEKNVGGFLTSLPEGHYYRICVCKIVRENEARARSFLKPLGIKKGVEKEANLGG